MKKREAELKGMDFTEDVKSGLRTVGSRIDQLEDVIEKQKIFINMESHKAYEQSLMKDKRGIFNFYFRKRFEKCY